MEEKLELLLESVNGHTRQALLALLDAHDNLCLYFTDLISEHDNELQTSIAKARFFATKTKIDTTEIDDAFKTTVLKLLILAKSSYDYFALAIHERSEEMTILLHSTCLSVIEDFIV